MSQELVRHKLSLRKRSGRTLEQRIAIRLPVVGDMWQWLMARLSPSSRLRQALLLRGTQGAFDALNRGDHEAMLLPYHPDVVFEQLGGDGEEGELGFQATYRGYEGFRKFQQEWQGDWAEIHHEPVELIDLGDRFVLLMEATARGEASGASVTQSMAVLSTINRQGKVIREQRYFEHAHALEAAGLSE